MVHAGYEFPGTPEVYRCGDMRAGGLRYGVHYDIETCVLFVSLDAVLDTFRVYCFLVQFLIEKEQGFPVLVYAFCFFPEEQFFLQRVYLIVFIISR